MGVQFTMWLMIPTIRRSAFYSAGVSALCQWDQREYASGQAAPRWIASCCPTDEWTCLCNLKPCGHSLHLWAVTPMASARPHTERRRRRSWSSGIHTALHHPPPQCLLERLPSSVAFFLAQHGLFLFWRVLNSLALFRLSRPDVHLICFFIIWGEYSKHVWYTI